MDYTVEMYSLHIKYRAVWWQCCLRLALYQQWYASIVIYWFRTQSPISDHTRYGYKMAGHVASWLLAAKGLGIILKIYSKVMCGTLYTEGPTTNWQRFQV